MRERDVHQRERRSGRHLVDIAGRNGNMQFSNPADERGKGIAQENQTLWIGRGFVVEFVAGVAQIHELEGGKPLGTSIDIYVINLTEPLQKDESNIFSPLQLCIKGRERTDKNKRLGLCGKLRKYITTQFHMLTL